MYESPGGISQTKLEPVEVSLGERSYRVHFDDDWEKVLTPFRRHKTAVITDENVADLHLNRWMSILPEAEPLVIPPGESSKCSRELEKIYTSLIEKRFSRDTLIIALGGGVVGDLAGYAAAAFMRGVDLIQIPTTLLAMVDAAIGGKVGINHPLGKNLIGAFHQPKAVLVDFRHLDTLPKREWLCGLGEMIKYAAISGSIDFDELAEGVNICRFSENWSPAENIRKCARFKADIVSRDERETSGERMTLNFGHTIAHAFEAATGYHTFKHGEAVIVGMAGAVYLSRSQTGLPEKELFGFINLLNKFPLPEIDENIQTRRLMEYILHDKKVRGGKIRFVLLESIGKIRIVDDIGEEELMDALNFSQRFLMRM